MLSVLHFLYAFHFLSLTVLVGHLSVWTWIYNRLHASRLPSRTVQRLENWVIVSTLATFCLVAARVFWRGPEWINARMHWSDSFLRTWALLCCGMLAGRRLVRVMRTPAGHSWCPTIRHDRCRTAGFSTGRIV
jgi:hypothetical protein